MASLREFQRRLQPLLNQNVIADKVAEITISKSNELLKAKKNEFDFGLLPNYKSIGFYQNTDYAFRKYNLNPLAGYGKVDLQLTGAFVNSFFLVRKSRSEYTFDASNTKKPFLIDRYGEDIMGLNQQTFNEFQRERVLPEVIQYIKSQLGQ